MNTRHSHSPAYFTDELWFGSLHQCLAHEDSDLKQSTDKFTLDFMYSAPLNPPHQRPTRKQKKKTDTRRKTKNTQQNRCS